MKFNIDECEYEFRATKKSLITTVKALTEKTIYMLYTEYKENGFEVGFIWDSYGARLAE